MLKIHSKNQWVLPWPMRWPFTKFNKNQDGSFCVIVLTSKQTNYTENITLAEVTMECYN